MEMDEEEVRAVLKEQNEKWEVLCPHTRVEVRSIFWPTRSQGWRHRGRQISISIRSMLWGCIERTEREIMHCFDMSSLTLCHLYCFLCETLVSYFSSSLMFSVWDRRILLFVIFAVFCVRPWYLLCFLCETVVSYFWSFFFFFFNLTYKFMRLLDSGIAEVLSTYAPDSVGEHLYEKIRYICGRLGSRWGFCLTLLDRSGVRTKGLDKHDRSLLSLFPPAFVSIPLDWTLFFFFYVYVSICLPLLDSDWWMHDKKCWRDWRPWSYPVLAENTLFFPSWPPWTTVSMSAPLLLPASPTTSRTRFQPTPNKQANFQISK